MTFSDSIVVITGAASGIGRELSRLFVGAGSRVMAVDIDRNGLDRLAVDLGERVTSHVCDLRDASAIRTTAEDILRVQGRVDVLINNAGIVIGKSLMEQTEADIEWTFRVNTFAPMLLTRAFLPSMMARNSGHVVTIASAGGLVATAGMSAYAASKFAAVGFDEALRLELRKTASRVKTTVVCPYYVDTGMFKGVRTRVPWLLPIMDPATVAHKTFRAIAKGRKRLLLPWFVYALYPTRLLPVPLFDRVLDLFGITSSMDDFRGR